MGKVGKAIGALGIGGPIVSGVFGLGSALLESHSQNSASDAQLRAQQEALAFQKQQAQQQQQYRQQRYDDYTNRWNAWNSQRQSMIGSLGAGRSTYGVGTIGSFIGK
jgi:hypothetical protein